jgi:hypothetical protein
MFYIDADDFGYSVDLNISVQKMPMLRCLLFGDAPDRLLC